MVGHVYFNTLLGHQVSRDQNMRNILYVAWKWLCFILDMSFYKILNIIHIIMLET